MQLRFGFSLEEKFQSQYYLGFEAARLIFQHICGFRWLRGINSREMLLPSFHGTIHYIISRFCSARSRTNAFRPYILTKDTPFSSRHRLSLSRHSTRVIDKGDARVLFERVPPSVSYSRDVTALINAQLSCSLVLVRDCTWKSDIIRCYRATQPKIMKSAGNTSCLSLDSTVS